MNLEMRKQAAISKCRTGRRPARANSLSAKYRIDKRKSSLKVASLIRAGDLVRRWWRPAGLGIGGGAVALTARQAEEDRRLGRKLRLQRGF